MVIDTIIAGVACFDVPPADSLFVGRIAVFTLNQYDMRQ